MTSEDAKYRIDPEGRRRFRGQRIWVPLFVLAATLWVFFDAQNPPLLSVEFWLMYFLMAASSMIALFIWFDELEQRERAPVWIRPGEVEAYHSTFLVIARRPRVIHVNDIETMSIEPLDTHVPLQSHLRPKGMKVVRSEWRAVVKLKDGRRRLVCIGSYKRIGLVASKAKGISRMKVEMQGYSEELSSLLAAPDSVENLDMTERLFENPLPTRIRIANLILPALVFVFVIPAYNLSSLFGDPGPGILVIGLILFFGFELLVRVWEVGFWPGRILISHDGLRLIYKWRKAREIPWTTVTSVSVGWNEIMGSSSGVSWQNGSATLTSDAAMAVLRAGVAAVGL